MRGFLEIEAIMTALVELAYSEKEDCKKDGFWEKIEPLANAMREGDYASIHKAVERRSPLFGKEDRLAELRYRAARIALNPQKFGIEKLTKADVLEILREMDPELLEFLPTSKGGKRDWYLSLGVTLEQSRGRPNPAIKKWIENRRKNPPKWKWDW